MDDLSYFETRIRTALPSNLRHVSEHALRSIAESRVMLYLYRSALPSLFGSVPPDAMVVAFGSFGRLDGAVGISDYDALFLYEGPPDALTTARLYELITELVRTNKALPFDHRRDIEDGRFPFAESPAYPVISIRELMSRDGQIRALQILTEGRALSPYEPVAKLKLNILHSLGYSPDVHDLRLGPLREALRHLVESYLGAFYAESPSTSGRLTNRKILKLFALREFIYLASLLAVAVLAVGVSVGAPDRSLGPHTPARLLSSPAILKVLHFIDPGGPLADTLNGLPDSVSLELCQRIERFVDAAVPEAKLAAPANSPSTTSLILHQLRALATPILMGYEKLLVRLHDVQFLARIDRWPTNIGSWEGHRSLAEIRTGRNDMIRATKLFAAALCDVLTFLSNNTEHFDFYEAQETLQAIVGYEIRRESGQ